MWDWEGPLVTSQCCLWAVNVRVYADSGFGVCVLTYVLPVCMSGCLRYTTGMVVVCLCFFFFFVIPNHLPNSVLIPDHSA